MNIGTTVLYANGRTSRAALDLGDVYGGAEIQKSVASLEKTYAAPYDGTNYVALISPDTKRAIQNIGIWLNTAEYSNPDAAYSGEIGTLLGVRYVGTPLATVYPGQGLHGQDVHATLTFGKDAFAKTELSGENIQMIPKALGESGEDRLNQRGSFGWKATQGGCIADQRFVIRVEASVTP